jgi:S1-C subfamily serine protease
MTTRLDLQELYRDVLPSVVSVYRTEGTGAGSAFVYDDHHVLTNEHVVRGVDAVSIRFSNGDWRDGEVVGRDAYTDLAVIAVVDLPESATPLRVASANPLPGTPVAALGNPLGLDGSITAGIVSGANRSMHTSGGFAIPDVVQTDAPINPGNSGGPLVTVDGDGYVVVGVNRAKAGDNVGFAVSPAIVSRVVPDLVDAGRYRHSYLRSRTLDVTPTIAEANGLTDPRGVLVVEAQGGPDGDGLRGSSGTARVDGRPVPVGGDVVVGIGGTPIRAHEELMRYLITKTRPGEPVDVDVVRAGTERRLTLTLDERPVAAVDERRREPRGRGGSRIPIE